MSHYTLISAAILAVAGTGAFAQSFSGGELGAEYNTFTDGIDLDGASYNGAVEFAVTQEFAFALDVDKVDLGDSSSDPRLTLHGIYHVGSASSVGLFYAETPGIDANNASFGIEGGMAFMGGDIGAYLGQQSFGDEDVVIFGLDSSIPVGGAFAIFSDFDLVTEDNVGVSTSEIGVSYLIENGPELYAQIGEATLFADNVSVSEAYVGLGARITFGAARGTTFQGR